MQCPLIWNKPSLEFREVEALELISGRDFVGADFYGSHFFLDQKSMGIHPKAEFKPTSTKIGDPCFGSFFFKGVLNSLIMLRNRAKKSKGTFWLVNIFPGRL